MMSSTSSSSVINDNDNSTSMSNNSNTHINARTMKKARTKVMQTVGRHEDILVSGNGGYARLYGSLDNDKDVLQINSTNNKRYMSILQQYQRGFHDAPPSFKRTIVCNVIKAVRPGRFIERKYGLCQWIEMKQCKIESLIRKELHHLSIKSASVAAADAAAMAAELVSTPRPSLPAKKRKATAAMLPSNKKRKMMSSLSSSSSLMQPYPAIISLPTHKQNTKKAPRKNPAATRVIVCPDEPVTNYLKLKDLQEERSRMSDYNQLLVLECFEFFQATATDEVRGRIVVGQLGLRCCFCAQKQQRNPASATFPGKIAAISGSICSLGSIHTINRRKQASTACPNVSPEFRARLNIISKQSQQQTNERGGTDLQGYFNRVASVCGMQNMKPKGLMLSVRKAAMRDISENSAAVGGRLDALTHAAIAPTIPKQATSNNNATSSSALTNRIALMDATPRISNVSTNNSVQINKREPQKRAPLRIKISTKNIALPKIAKIQDNVIPDNNNKVFTSRGGDASKMMAEKTTASYSDTATLTKAKMHTDTSPPFDTRSAHTGTNKAPTMTQKENRINSNVRASPTALNKTLTQKGLSPSKGDVVTSISQTQTKSVLQKGVSVSVSNTNCISVSVSNKPTIPRDPSFKGSAVSINKVSTEPAVQKSAASSSNIRTTPVARKDLSLTSMLLLDTASNPKSSNTALNNKSTTVTGATKYATNALEDVADKKSSPSTMEAAAMGEEECTI